MGEFLDWEYKKYQRNLHWGLFFLHVAIYSLTNLLFLIINMTGSRQYLWFIYPVILWGIVLALHYGLVRFALSGRLQQYWENLLKRF